MSNHTCTNGGCNILGCVEILNDHVLKTIESHTQQQEIIVHDNVPTKMNNGVAPSLIWSTSNFHVILKWASID